MANMTQFTMAATNYSALSSPEMRSVEMTWDEVRLVMRKRHYHLSKTCVYHQTYDQEVTGLTSGQVMAV